MDEGDISAEREEIERQSARLTCKKAEGPKPTGSCLYCEVPVETNGMGWQNVGAEGARASTTLLSLI